MEDIVFLRNEIDMWIREILKNGFSKIAKQAKMQGGKIETAIQERLAGLNVTEGQIKQALRDLTLPEDPMKWDDDVLLKLATKMREVSKPMIIAMNKSDIAPAGNIEKVSKENPLAVITMSETELALKKAASSGLIEYVPGSPEFKIKNEEKLNAGQRQALDFMAQKMKMYNGTGVQTCLEKAVFGMLDLIVVYPVEDEGKLTDHFGRVLPDALLMPRGSTAKDMAYKVHTDLGDKFIRAVNTRTKRTIGHDYILQDGDIIKIIAGK